MLGGLLAAWAAVVWFTGGLAFDVGGVRVSSRSPGRPALVAALALLAASWAGTAAQRRARVGYARRQGDRLAPWGAAVVAIAVTAVSALYGAHVAGGADASGYVSQSRRWAEGRVRMEAPDLVGAEWPRRGWLVAPLGYAPSHVPGELGPTYAPGLPWLMALGAAVFGEAGRFIWTPLAVGLLTWGTFLFARREAPPLVALGAGVLVAASAPVLFAAMQTMSDLAGAAFWLGALLALDGSGLGTTLASGTLAALALLVRPNLVVVAGAVWAADVAASRGTWRARSVRAATWAAPVAVAAGAIAGVNALLWGSPTSSGYGPNADLFSLAHVPGNLARLWRWTIETSGYWSLAGLVALPWTCATRERRRWWPAAALVASVAASYVLYAEFEEWWYLRFYLAAWPVLAAAASVAAWRVLARWSDDGAVLVVALATMALGSAGVTHADDVATFRLWKGEQRYAAVAAFVDAQAPRDAVVLAVQHSGAVSYYAHRAIGRWDYIDPAGLDAFVSRLAADGRVTWLVADDWEELPFRQRFAGDTRGHLDWAPLGEARIGASRVRVYDLTTPTRAVGPALIPVATASPWPWARLHRPAAAR